jgi:hypothetical protein
VKRGNEEKGQGLDVEGKTQGAGVFSSFSRLLTSFLAVRSVARSFTATVGMEIVPPFVPLRVKRWGSAPVAI